MRKKEDLIEKAKKKKRRKRHYYDEVAVLNSTGEIFDIVSSSNSIVLKHDPTHESQKIITSKPPIHASTSS